MSKEDDKQDMPKPQKTLADSVHRHVERYLAQLNGEVPTQLYQLVIGEAERPLLECVMRYTDQNQSEAARILGINRNTLRSKLQHYQLL